MPLFSDTNVIDAVSFSIMTLEGRTLSITLSKSATSIMTLNAECHVVYFCAVCAVFIVMLDVIIE